MNNRIKEITGVGILASLVIVLQLISNYVTFGQISITLSLIPIVIGAILYGKNAGALLGAINGIIVILAPSTLGSFMPFNPLATIILCLLKTSIAGYVSGLIYELLNKQNYIVSIVLAAISVPIINTSIFIIGTLTFFVPLLESWSGSSDIYTYLFLTLIGINFVIEFTINSALSPTIIYIINTFKKLMTK